MPNSLDTQFQLNIPKEKLIISRRERFGQVSLKDAALFGATGYLAVRTAKLALKYREVKNIGNLINVKFTGVGLAIGVAIDVGQYVYERYCRHNFMDISFDDSASMEYAIQLEAPGTLAAINNSLSNLKKYSWTGWLPSSVTTITELLVCLSNHDGDVIRLLGELTAGDFKYTGLIFAKCDNEMDYSPMPDITSAIASDFFDFACMVMAAAGYPAYITHVGDCTRLGPINCCRPTALFDAKGQKHRVPQYALVSPDVVSEAVSSSSSSVFYSSYFVNKVCLYLMGSLATMGLIPLAMVGNGSSFDFRPVDLKTLRGETCKDKTPTMWNAFSFHVDKPSPIQLKAITKSGVLDYDEVAGNSFGLNACREGGLYVGAE
jgi:hypothetical protein